MPDRSLSMENQGIRGAKRPRGWSGCGWITKAKLWVWGRRRLRH